MRPWEDRAVLLQQMYLGIEFNLFFHGQSIPPSLEFVGVLDLPCHISNITSMEYNVNGIQCLLFLLMSRIIPPSCTMGAPTHMGIPEPKDVYPEERFQSAIVAVMRDVLNASGQKFVLLEGFGLDIAIFIATPYGSIARFIEVKAFGAQRMGGVGFGNGRGVGAQVDLLLTHDNCLSLLDPIVRWTYVDATREIGSKRYCLFTCEKAKVGAMGGVARGKQNNLRISAFEQNLVDWVQLQIQIQQFLLAGESMAVIG